MKRHHLAAICSLILALSAHAGDCTKTGSVCIDGAPCKTISGVQVCLSQFGLSCWTYQDTYTCLKPNAVNYCQPFIQAQPACWQTNSQCAQMDSLFNTGCMKYTQTWRCSNPNQATPANTIRLDDTYTLVSSGYNTAQCDAQAAQAGCTLAQDRCIQTSPGSPLPAGISPAQVAPDGCYQRQRTYACYALAPAQLTGCLQSRSTCLDSTPTKAVNGVSVRVSQVGGCWQYRDDCLAANAVNYCAAFEADAQCRNTAITCLQTDTTFASGCMKYQATWRCGDPGRPTPTNTIRLDDTYTLVSSDYATTPCQSAASNPYCQLADSQCLSTTPPVLPSGITSAQVAPDGCYQKQNTYACLGNTDTSECAGYAANPQCIFLTSSCDPADMIGGQCSFEQQTYRCLSKPAASSTETNCAGQVFCAGGNCFDKGAPNDPDFARAMALMEAAREAGVYGSDVAVFSGHDSRCRIKLFGLSNCCRQAGGGSAFSNAALLGTAVKVGGELLDAGSGYVYDALSDAPTLQRGLGAAINTLSGGSADGMFNPSFSFYGFSFEFLPSQGLVFTGFDPTSLAIQLGVMILQELMACEPPEQILAMRRGQHLCHEIGTYCSQELNLLLAKVCIEHTQSHCCYNSRLARILNEQGRAQIGKSWGNPKSPDCSGFSQAEFAEIDFSKIDLSEFTAEIMANIKLPDVSAMGQQIQSSVQQKVQSYYQR